MTEQGKRRFPFVIHIGHKPLIKEITAGPNNALGTHIPSADDIAKLNEMIEKALPVIPNQKEIFHRKRYRKKRMQKNSRS